jgi:hypothetical protein
MNMTASILFLVVTGVTSTASAQNVRDVDLARRLADPGTRADAIAGIVTSEPGNIQRLLSFGEAPPPHLNRTELFIGLAELFGQLRTKEAIPFLIKNISLARWVRPNIWSKTPHSVEEHLPAVAALIAIGPEASRALTSLEWLHMTVEDHLAAIFVISRIGDPASKAFLLSAVAEAGMERSYAEEGLKLLDNLQR